MPRAMPDGRGFGEQWVISSHRSGPRAPLGRSEALGTMRPTDLRDRPARPGGFHGTGFPTPVGNAIRPGRAGEARQGSTGRTGLARRCHRPSQPTMWDACLTALSQQGSAVPDQGIFDPALTVARHRGSITAHGNWPKTGPP